MPDRRSAVAPSLALSLLLLAGCAPPPTTVAPSGATGYIEAPQPIDNAVWHDAANVGVTLSNYAFMPPRMAFIPDQPYRLTLSNVSDEEHTFTAEEFFKAIAVRRLTGADGERLRPNLLSIGFEAGETKVLEFVPIRPGTYEFICTRPFHTAFGMAGTIEIQDR